MTPPLMASACGRYRAPVCLFARPQLDENLDGPRSRCELCAEEKNISLSELDPGLSCP